MKTIKIMIMKKALMVTSLFIMILVNTAFVTKNIAPSGEEEFIYVIAYAGNQNTSPDYYISGIIQYQGFDACSKDYTTKGALFGEAGLKFKDGLEEYSEQNKIPYKNDWKVQYEGSNGSVSFPSGLFKGFATRAEAQKAIDTFIRKKATNSVKVFNTGFTYSCE